MRAPNILRYEAFKTRWCQAFCVIIALTTRLSTGELANQSVLQGAIIRKHVSEFQNISNWTAKYQTIFLP